MKKGVCVRKEERICVFCITSFFPQVISIVNHLTKEDV